MTDKTKMTDELIMAYADGELPEIEARKVEHAAEADEEIRLKVQLFKDTARQLKSAAAELPPVSDALAEKVASMLAADAENERQASTGNVVPLRNRAWSQHWPAALAACITLAVGLATGIAIGPGNAPRPASPFGITALADPEIAIVLSSLESGASKVLSSGATLNVIASFADADSTLCREFDYEAVNGPSIVSIACKESETWHPKIAIATNAEPAAGFAPASSLDALEAWLVSSGLGNPLEPAEEKRRLSQDQS